MGEVILVFRVLPDSPENCNKLRENLNSLSPERIEEEPLAFGLTAFKVTFIVPDEGGAQEEVEKKIEGLEHLESYELVMASRSL